jgi:hypothetical protein
VQAAARDPIVPSPRSRSVAAIAGAIAIAGVIAATFILRGVLRDPPPPPLQAAATAPPPIDASLTTDLDGAVEPVAADARSTTTPDAAVEQPSSHRTDAAVESRPGRTSSKATPTSAPAVKRDEPTRVTPAPVARVGTIVVVARPWADVSIDGVPRGRAEPPAARFQVELGEHTVVLSHPVTNIRTTRRVTVTDRVPVEVRADLARAAEPAAP